MQLAGNSLETHPASTITDGVRQISLYGTRRGEFGRQKAVLFPEVIYIGKGSHHLKILVLCQVGPLNVFFVSSRTT